MFYHFLKVIPVHDLGIIFHPWVSMGSQSLSLSLVSLSIYTDMSKVAYMPI